MAQHARWTLGSPWIDNLLPGASGAVCGLIVIRLGGPLWSLLAAPALFWSIWQLSCRLTDRLVVQVLLVTAIAAAILVYTLLSLRVDTAKLREVVSQAGIEVKAVSSDRDEVSVSIQPASWGPERNQALRKIFEAAHRHAKSKKRVSIHWGDAMTTTIGMKDIAAFIEGQITYREILNRLEWSGTPDILPDDSSGARTELELLAALAAKPGQILSRSQRMEVLNTYRGTSLWTIDNHIKNLRAKIEPDPRHPSYGLNIFGIGYALNGRP